MPSQPSSGTLKRTDGWPSETTPAAEDEERGAAAKAKAEKEETRMTSRKAKAAKAKAEKEETRMTSRKAKAAVAKAAGAKVAKA